MQILPLRTLAIAGCGAILTLSAPAIAQTQIEINYDTPAFSDREIRAGAIRVVVDYHKVYDRPSVANTENISYRIFYNNVEKVRQQSEDTTGQFFFQDLDNDKIPEAIVSTYSGGAHCCTNTRIYSWKSNRFLTAETGYLDGGGGEFRDLNRDGRVEFVTYDNAFLYQFSSYAGSFPPTRILSFNNGKLENVTRKFPAELKAHAWRMYQAFLEAKRENISEVNGVLAGYVAQKTLLGEYQEGWQFMLVHYDRTSDWGLDIYRGEQRVGSYPDFPTALKAFLTEQGYL